MDRRIGVRVALRVWVLVWALAAHAQPPRQDLPKDAGELVRTVIANELKPDPHEQHYEFKVTRKRPERTEVRQIVNTPSGTLARVVLVNGKPLTPEQRAKEEARLRRLVDDPSQMAAKRKQQQDDERRTRNMVKALPDAFLYEYAGRESKAPWGDIAILKFKPNPAFDPPTQETKVYRGMEGEMWVDLSEMRMAKIDAKLVRDVAFGWGILGHLDQGGAFFFEQKPIKAGLWAPYHMVLNFTGRVLLFKSIKIRQDDTFSDYRPVADMSVAQALEFLKKQEAEVAQSK